MTELFSVRGFPYFILPPRVFEVGASVAWPILGKSWRILNGE